MAKKQPSFEERMTALEELVRKMEGGSLPLNESLAAYEEGIRLSKQLAEELAAAEKRMLELSGGQLVPMEDAP